jgi:hypothetical protein
MCPAKKYQYSTWREGMKRQGNWLVLGTVLTSKGGWKSLVIKLEISLLQDKQVGWFGIKRVDQNM